MLAILVWSCAPSTKEEYLDSYARFMDKVSKRYSEFTDSDWSDAEETLNKFKGEYYKLFESELTATEKLSIVGHEMKFAYYQVVDEAKDYVDSLKEDPKIKAKIDKFNGVIDSLVNDPEMQKQLKNLEDYFENGFSKDMEQLGGSLENIGNDMEEVFEHIGSDAEDFFNDVSSQIETIFDDK